ncbi:trna-specific adenosine deaminase [Stemphylium lycopersici]|uniref:Trna-specific adenosine deaminase n=1 Tax=Stemphylium lycopersici TaxID=183478 RepID=A0A364MY92_STELY|nr:trna-specific adenosine deaminase [Stemphylium lycopersici]RAR00014.1 trna-specific adenosine deaminase [Stemphylium lycopersici]RAR06972.1 trna-specific adenosine deaminase [Stemphylium lycopersici]
MTAPHPTPPRAILPASNVLHDWHAEVVAIRAFNRFLLDECLLISSPPYPTSDFIKQPDTEEHASQPFAIRDDVSIHMYCSEAPCGDASMELTMAAQEDATPWTSEAPTIQALTSSSPGVQSENENSASALRGRSNFSHLGVVRAKPSRPDAPPTLSKSCTDKLALKQATSLLSSTASLFISPKNAYLDTLVLPASQYVPQACHRAFLPTGRLESLFSSGSEPWGGGYRFQPFTVHSTSREFAWSRRALAPGDKAMPSNLSAVWTPHWQETLIGGVLQGRKQLDPRGASRISRRGLWIEGVRLAAMVGGVVSTVGSGALLSKDETYGEMKDSSLLKERKRVKEDVQSVLKGWLRNTGDDNWSLNDVVLP